ncbi:MAG: SURF1 family protein [Steroidobacteraceae bacterium]
MTALSALAIVVFIGFGRWQWQRGVEKEATWRDFAAAEGPATLPGTDSLEALPRFARVRLTGRYDAAHQFLLDNRTHKGAAGYEVLTPLELDDGRLVLVNRGWVPFSGYRDRLPDITLADAATPVAVTGRLEELPHEGMASGRAPPTAGGTWPQVTSFPHIGEIEAVLGRPVEVRQLLLDPSQPAGYVREWQPPGIPPERHLSYAVQWWLFAATVAVLYGVLNLHKVNR